MDDFRPYGYEYRDEEWPWGLKCMDCDHVLAEGDRYASRLVGMTEFADEPAAVVEVVCLDCALLLV